MAIGSVEMKYTNSHTRPMDMYNVLCDGRYPLTTEKKVCTAMRVINMLEDKSPVETKKPCAQHVLVSTRTAFRLIHVELRAKAID